MNKEDKEKYLSNLKTSSWLIKAKNRVMNKENIEPKNQIKTAVEILNSDRYHSRFKLLNSNDKKRVTDAMEEYANQFKPPAISYNEGETVEATNVQEGKFEALLRRYGIFEYDVRMNAVIDELRTQWQSQHSYAEADKIENLKQAINQDKTGLAKGLESVYNLAKSYDWIKDGRGPYAFDDERYKGEVLNMINEIQEVSLKALQESGVLANNAFGGIFKTIEKPECYSTDTEDKWISVEDGEKPKHDQWVLCAANTSKGFDNLLPAYSYNAKYDDYTGYGEAQRDARVTHWQPLPSPPKK